MIQSFIGEPPQPHRRLVSCQRGVNKRALAPAPAVLRQFLRPTWAFPILLSVKPKSIGAGPPLIPLLRPTLDKRDSRNLCRDRIST
jgi:hypothetical protein